jgi:hypothetical protein
MDIIYKNIRKLLVFITMMGLVGCNLPRKSLTPVRPHGSNVTPQASNPNLNPSLNPNRNPSNVFGITLYTLDGAGGLLQRLSWDWTRSDLLEYNRASPGDRLGCRLGARAY